MEIFLQIMKYFCNPVVSLFDSDLNHHVPKFLSF